jgi:hypothetical protein
VLVGDEREQAKLPIAIAAAKIFGAESERSARTLLAALPGFSSLDQDTLGRYVSWLGRTYPGSRRSIRSTHGDLPPGTSSQCCGSIPTSSQPWPECSTTGKSSRR